MNAIVNLTASAKSQLKNLKKSLSLDDSHFVRIGVKGGKGCMGVSHVIAFDHKTDEDNLYTIDDIPIIIDKKHSMHVIGLTVDYYEDKHSKGFVFETDTEEE